MQAAQWELWWILVAAGLVAVVLGAAVVVAVLVQQRRFLAAHREFSGRLLVAQEEERAWIARELHDDLIQRVGLLTQEVVGVRGQLRDPGMAAHRLTGLEAELHDLTEEIRRLAHRMHPSVLDNLGLPAALRALGEEVETAERLPVRVLVDEPAPPLTPAAALSLYRVAQEALRNVVKHAAASEATVRLVRNGGGAVLEVVDAGRGFDPARDGERRGLGLTSMTERLRLVRGTLRVVSAPGRGTRTTAWVPLAGG
ncbi:MAG TPA: sensor histidine kinase [Gemmatimonadales bacterium]|nr:sensor histidine kinase [Gemmatimonadales bacterium]